MSPKYSSSNVLSISTRLYHCRPDAEYEYFEQRQLPARPVQPGLQPLLQVPPDDDDGDGDDDGDDGGDDDGDDGGDDDGDGDWISADCLHLSS